MCAPQVMVWTVLGMFLNPNRVGPFFAAVTGFVFHIMSYYNGLQDQFKQAKIKLKEMLLEFRQKFQAEVAAKAKELASRIEDHTAKVVGGVDDFAQDAAAKLGLSSNGGGGGAGGSLVVPEFVSRILEDVAMQKIELQDVPDEVQRRMLELVNAKLDAYGVMDELEFVVEISSLVAKGDHAGVKRVIINKLWELLHALLEAEGFSVALETLMEKARDNTQQTLENVQDRKDQLTTQLTGQLTKSSAEIVERLVKDVLAKRGLAGPASMQPLLSTELKEILRQIIVDASDGPMAFDALHKFVQAISTKLDQAITTKLDQARQTSGQDVMQSGFDMLDSAHEQSSDGQLSLSLAERLKDGMMLVIRTEAEQCMLLRGLEFVMQMSAVSGSASYRCWTIANAAFDLLLEHSGTAEDLFDEFLKLDSASKQVDAFAGTVSTQLGNRFDQVFGDMGFIGEDSDRSQPVSVLRTFLIGTMNPVDDTKNQRKHLNHTIKRIRAKYGNFKEDKGKEAMKRVQEGILDFVRKKVEQSFNTDLGMEKADKLRTISRIEDLDEKRAKLSLEIAELRSWAESEVASYWCAIQSTKKRTALVESLSSVLCCEMGTEWQKIKWEEVEGEALKEIHCEELEKKIISVRPKESAAASHSFVTLAEGVKGMTITLKGGGEKGIEVSRGMYVKVDQDYYRPKNGCDEAEEDSWGPNAPNENDHGYFKGACACMPVHGPMAKRRLLL